MISKQHNTAVTRQWLADKVLEMRPWHHDIQITNDLCSGELFSPDRRLPPSENDGVSLISPRSRFLTYIDAIFPHGMQGKRYLDCACNGGGYCFWARERNVEFALGFDVREHWIQQAEFVQEYRTVGPVDRIEFKVMDLYDLPKQELEQFDLTLFSGIFYHLPDPITGLKIAADLTRDIIIVNTSTADDTHDRTGLTMAKEGTEPVMSGVYHMAWFPNGPHTIKELLRWMGFVEMKLTMDKTSSGARRRIEIYAAREKGRLARVNGTRLL